MVKQKIKQLLQQSVLEMGFNGDDIVLSIPQSPTFGDYSSNIALQLAKSKSSKIKQNPVEIAKELAVRLKRQAESEGWLERVEVAGAGFINFYVSPEILAGDLGEILKDDSEFGKNNLGQGKSVQVEFISANPTGPLTLANGRGGALGDTLANTLIHSGYSVEREFYVNDTGNQVRLLGASVKAVLGLIEPAENHYQGEYVKDLAQKLQSSRPDLSSLDEQELGHMAADHLMENDIKPAIERLGIKFDRFYSERTLYKDGKIDSTLKLLQEHDLVYEKDGAVWFKSTKFGDEKDRAMMTSALNRGKEEPTYLLADTAHHIDIYSQGMSKRINFLGADHHGNAAVIQMVMKSLGYQDRLDIVLFQLVRLFKEGKEVKMSKRAGNFVTLDELLDLVSADVARFFFLMYAPNSHINFNLDLATETSQKNPVYFVQYAHARMSGILEKAGSGKGEGESGELGLLTDPHEIALTKHLLEFPGLIEDIAKSYQVHYLSEYAIHLADLFHKFYEACPVMTAEGDGLKEARLSLVKAAQIVLGSTLGLMGVGAPHKM